MDEKGHGRVEGDHEVHVINRETITVKGVLHVDSFDDQEIVLDTEVGTLTLKGEDLRIKQLDVEDGSFAVEGLLTSLQYAMNRGKALKARGKGFLDRLLR